MYNLSLTEEQMRLVLDGLHRITDPGVTIATVDRHELNLLGLTASTKMTLARLCVDSDGLKVSYNGGMWSPGVGDVQAVPDSGDRKAAARSLREGLAAAKPVSDGLATMLRPSVTTSHIPTGGGFHNVHVGPIDECPACAAIESVR